MSATIHYMPKIPKLLPPAERDGCQHAGQHALVIGSRIVTCKGRSGVSCDAHLCMACGTIWPVDADYRHYHHALAYFWEEWGWHRGIGRRLKELADKSTTTPFQSFVALRSGLAPDEADRYSIANKAYRADARRMRRLHDWPRKRGGKARAA